MGSGRGTADRNFEAQQEQVVRAYDQFIGSAEAIRLRSSWSYFFSKVITDHFLLAQAGVEGKRVLNVGGSIPIDEILFAYLARQWVSIDLSQRSLQEGLSTVRRELSPVLAARVAFVGADATRLPFGDGIFDLACSFSTLDHIPDGERRRRAVEEMARVTRAGGHAIITVPNKLDWIYSWLSRRQQQRGEGVYEYCFTPWELRRLLQNCRLEPLAFTSTLYNPGSVFERRLNRLGLHWMKFFGTRMGYLARKLA